MDCKIAAAGAEEAVAAADRSRRRRLSPYPAVATGRTEAKRASKRHRPSPCPATWRTEAKKASKRRRPTSFSDDYDDDEGEPPYAFKLWAETPPGQYDRRYPPPVPHPDGDYDSDIDMPFRSYLPPATDDGDREPYYCFLCNRETEHGTLSCPYMYLATQLHVFKSKPPKHLRLAIYYIDINGDIHDDVSCVGAYRHAGLKDVERSAADAVVLHKGELMNLVRITNLLEDIKEPEPLFKWSEKFGAVTHAIVIRDQGVGFVNFVKENAAKEAIKELKCSGVCNGEWAKTLSSE